MASQGSTRVKASRTLYPGRPGGRAITVEDLWKLPRVGEPVASADGLSLAVAVKSYDLDKNAGKSRIWLIATTDGTLRPLTAVDTDAAQPAFSPDGRTMAFVRAHGPMKQLWTMPVDGGEATPHTDMPLGVVDPRWLPDGTGIVFVSQVLKGLTVEATRAELKRRADDGVAVHVTEDRVYRYWDRWLTTGEVPHLFVYTLGTGAIRDLMPESTLWMGLMELDGHYDVAPDSRELAFEGVFVDGPQEYLRSAIYTVPVAGGEVTCITEDVAPRATAPRYDPSDGSIVYGVAHDLFFYADRTRLHRYDRQSRKHFEVLTDWDHSPLAWQIGKDGRIFFDAEMDGRTCLFELKGGVPRRLTVDGTVSTPRVTSGARLYFAQQSLNEPAEIYTLDADADELRSVRLTQFTAAVMADVSVGEVRDFEVIGAEGEVVQMFVVLPPDGLASGPAPLVHVIHGGPHGITGDLFHPRWNAQLFAAPGYVVACVNFQGSTSRGQSFAQRIQGEWGARPYHDVIAATDALIELGLVDPRRMAVAGGSYGGYLASWITTQTDRFQCCINHAGVFDLLSQYASDVTQGRDQAVGGEPWRDIAAMDRYSPSRWTAGISTPTLVLHGEKDFRVPITQGLECYNMLKAKGVPARLVYFEQENHWVLSPKTSRVWYREVHAWLDRYLKSTAELV